MKHGAWGLAVGVVALIAACSSDDAAPSNAGTGGCGQLPDASGDTATEATGACPGVAPNSSPDCDACRASACCDEAQACLADQDCAKWLACEDACSPDDGACVSGCWKNNPGPLVKSEYSACKQRNCADVCGVKACSGPSFAYEALIPEDGGLGCSKVHCCVEAETCFEDPGCTDLQECWASCPDVSCGLAKCNDKVHQPYAPKLAALVVCRNRYCLEALDDCSVAFGFGAACTTCVHDNCCAETKACSDDVECVLHQYCIWGCGIDASCKKDCDAKYWIGGGLNWGMTYCLRQSCASACGQGGPNTCGGFDETSAGCKTCMDQKCCAEGDACGTNASCAGIHICVDACGADPACQDKCLKTALPAGVSVYQALTTCRSTQCAAECGQ